MIYINILTEADYPNFMHQLNVERYGNEYCFYENSEEDIKWDMVVVYEGLKSDVELWVKNGGLLFISGEPPMSRYYVRSFIRQFDNVISAHSRIQNNICSQQGLNWHFGYNRDDNDYVYSFDQVKRLDLPCKSKNISIISSSNTMMPGHNKRMQVIDKIIKHYEKEIDLFGKDINPISVKATGILPYRYHICIENSFIPDYWTEKIADPLLGYSVPIYCGCTNISDYFDERSFIGFNIKRYDKLFRTLDKLLDNPEIIYNKMLPYLIDSRNKLLYEYNIFAVIEKYYNDKCKYGASVNKRKIRQNKSFFDYKYMNYVLRLKRRVLKLF